MAHPRAGVCFGPGMPLNRPEYEDEAGGRTRLYATELDGLSGMMASFLGDYAARREVQPSIRAAPQDLSTLEAWKDFLSYIILGVDGLNSRVGEDASTLLMTLKKKDADTLSTAWDMAIVRMTMDS